jgi:hypothetical protein
MLYFYRKNESVPINLFHPRWLVDSASILHKPWQIRLNNFNYTRGDDISTEENTGDQSLGASKQLIIDTTLAIIEKHQNLPPSQRETFTLTFKKISDSLVKKSRPKAREIEGNTSKTPSLTLLFNRKFRLYQGESVHLPVGRLQSFRRRKKLDYVVGHRLQLKSRNRTMPGKNGPLHYTPS